MLDVFMCPGMHPDLVQLVERAELPRATDQDADGSFSETSAQDVNTVSSNCSFEL